MFAPTIEVMVTGLHDAFYSQSFKGLKLSAAIPCLMVIQP